MRAQLIVNTKNKGESLGDLFGIFFEDLNHAADGGIYAELVQNCSFEFDPIDNHSYHALTAWEKVELGNGKVNLEVETLKPLNQNNQHYVTLDVIEVGEGVGLKNIGFNTGIPFKKGENYLFSFYARCENNTQKIKISFESIDGAVYGEDEVIIDTPEWKMYETTIKAYQTDYSGRLVITTKEKGKFALDMISLFPENTFNQRKNGLREDLVKLLIDLKPKFMRFPGGCLVHDGSLDSSARDSMYRWKNTIGAIENRPARRSNWGYNQTLGLGYFEYFLLCEDLGTKPIPVIPGGYNPHRKEAVPLDELEPWIDDALDLIEFANGDTNTKWGKIRAELGHKEPFNLEYIGIGNEEVGEQFFERYPYFHRAIKEKYPHIKVINSSGPFAAGSEYERGWKSAKEHNSDLVDEHYYNSPEWFLANYHRYDDFKATDPKVFLGEYATWGNTYYNALVEAAFMTGLEKNAKAIGLACYAPLLCNVGYINWRPDMIYFNNHQAFGSANYYVQKLFMNHQGSNLLNIDAIGLEEIKTPKVDGIIGKISLKCDGIDALFSDIKITNNKTKEVKSLPDVLLAHDHPDLEIDNSNCDDYKVSLKAVRVKGHKGFFIYFGEKDTHNRLRWEVGGWQNQDALINAFVSGRSSVLTQSIFSLETNREYNLELHVKGRTIKTYIDGILVNETEDKLPVIEPLYYSASIEDITNDIIIKVVNVQDKPVVTDINLSDIDKKISGIIYQLSGYNLSDENCFDHPELIKPKEIPFNDFNNGFTYEFPKQSVTIIRVFG